MTAALARPSKRHSCFLVVSRLYVVSRKHERRGALKSARCAPHFLKHVHCCVPTCMMSLKATPRCTRCQRALHWTLGILRFFSRSARSRRGGSAREESKQTGFDDVCECCVRSASPDDGVTKQRSSISTIDCWSNRNVDQQLGSSSPAPQEQTLFPCDRYDPRQFAQL